MKRWAILVAALYGLVLLTLTVPFVWLATYPNFHPSQALEDTSIFEFWPYFLGLGLMVLCQYILLAVPVRVASLRPVTKGSLAPTILMAGLAMAALVLGATLSLYEFAYGGKHPKNSIIDWMPIGLAVVTWIAWTLLFFRMSRRTNAIDLVSRQCRILFTGSILELLIAVPTHIVARNREYCCAGLYTMVGLTTGLSVMLFAFGPAVFFLFADRWNRLHPSHNDKTHPSPSIPSFKVQFPVGNIGNKIRLFSVILLGGICAWLITVAASRLKQPEMISPTEASANWSTYTSVENGFSIKYPANKFLMSVSADRVHFSNPADGEFDIQRVDQPVNQVMIQYQKSAVQFSNFNSTLFVNGLKATRMISRVGNFEGVWKVPNIFIENGSSTYIITCSYDKFRPGSGTTMPSTSVEMIGTFKLIDRVHSEYQTYIDSKYGFAFEYPTAWYLAFGGDRVTVRGSSDHVIWIFVKEKTTAEDFQKGKWSYVVDMGPEEKFFAHKITGRKCMWMDKEAYVFEKDGNLIIIRMQYMNSPSKTVDDILDSFRL